MPEEEQSFIKPAPKPSDTKVKYIGMHPKVRVPAWKDQWIEHGEVITVPAELAKGLCQQTGNWELVKEKAETKPPKKTPDKGPAKDAPEEE